MSWTDEKIEGLRKLWAEGKSTGEIGKIIGMSKNAVVGKAHRLGLEGRPSPIKRDGAKVGKTAGATRASASAPASAVAKKAVSGAVKPAPASASASAVAPVANVKRVKPKAGEKFTQLADLTMRSCRWPVGDPKDPDFHFCGKEAVLGRPYCEEHLAEAFVSVAKR